MPSRTERERPKRCGQCTLCCTVVPVAEIEKPRNSPCQHLAHGGCGIYAFRPRSCKTWSCAWLVTPTMNASWRPDRCHIVIDVMTDHVLVTPHGTGRSEAIEVGQIWLEEGYDHLVASERMDAIVEAAARNHHLAVIIRFADGTCLVRAHASIAADGKDFTGKRSQPVDQIEFKRRVAAALSEEESNV